MRPEEARGVLGVEVTATAAEVRAAWRRSVRGTHPDVTVGADAAARTARINQAYAVLRSLPPPPPAPPPPPPTTVEGDDTLVIPAPGAEAYLTLLEAAHRAGDVTYVDRSAGLLELLVEVEGVGPCSVLVTLQGRSDGTTHAFVTIESLSHPGWRPSPPVLAAVMRALAA